MTFISNRDQLQEHLMLKQYYLQVDMSHLINYNAGLANNLTNSPAEHLPLVSLWTT
jgi:DNA replication licensing factor MCM5